MPAHPFDELGVDGAHVVANFTEPHRLDQGAQHLLLHAQFLRNLVHPDLAHRSSATTPFDIETADLNAAASGCDVIPKTATSSLPPSEPSRFFVPHATPPRLARARCMRPIDAAAA